jgi:O-antigen ligase
MGMKRGAILIGVVASILFLYANVINSSKWMKLLFAVLTITIVVGASKYIDYMMNSSEYFMARYEQTLEGNTSGRDVIYGSLWDVFLSETNPFYFYLGRGAESTITIIGKLAHQDWLETFCNNGFLGILILFFFFYTFAKNVWRSKQYFPKMMFYSFVTLFIITFSKTLFSMSIQNLDLPITMLLGYFAYWVSQPTDNVEIYNYEQEE